MKQNKNVVRLTESQLRNMIAESVKNVLNEFRNTNNFSTDYDGNDLNYGSVFDQALNVLRKNNNRQPIRWQNIAQQMGFRMETLNPEDVELLHDAIEDAMTQYDNYYVLDSHDALEVDKQDTDFEKFF